MEIWLDLQGCLGRDKSELRCGRIAHSVTVFFQVRVTFRNVRGKSYSELVQVAELKIWLIGNRRFHFIIIGRHEYLTQLQSSGNSKQQKIVQKLYCKNFSFYKLISGFGAVLAPKLLYIRLSQTYMWATGFDEQI
ncbi:hypothetical protein SS50377_28507 [Spironucleus salmonicida]|uniref:Uncharacterized protein n=1 Tax=Spironucleus salmonicida TaxID=348837 RepID=V6LER3_9EUKA|nr:hypothetical protein SS50377_28507 [Spironucleus salmonicida]|eukprot:EST42753.1 Hypothetical protein SS50377_17611 [Spironucleus salmonicida]